MIFIVQGFWIIVFIFIVIFTTFQPSVLFCFLFFYSVFDKIHFSAMFTFFLLTISRSGRRVEIR